MFHRWATVGQEARGEKNVNSGMWTETESHCDNNLYLNNIFHQAMHQILHLQYISFVHQDNRIHRMEGGCVASWDLWA